MTALRDAAAAWFGTRLSTEYQIAEMSGGRSVNADILEVTEFGDGWKVKIAGLRTGRFVLRPFDESCDERQDAQPGPRLTGGTSETFGCS